ncbi:MAG: efflux RND transporter permease subunit, partial [Sandaracinaceae bacterium]
MQWLAEVCVKRPVFTWVLVLSLVVVGGASVFGLGVDRFPDIDFPAVVVTVQLPGASPEQVETEVVEPIEEAVSSISGLDQLSSNSFEGLAVVIVQFELEKNSDAAAQEVRDRIDRILPLLPPEIEAPRVERIDPDAAPVMQIAVTSSRSTREITEFADHVIRRRIESLAGVGGVTIRGGREREIRVTVDPGRLAAVGLTARDVQRALIAENAEVPGGSVDEGSRTFQLRVQGRVTEPSELELIPIADIGGRVVRVGDVAEVRDGEAEAASSAALNGREIVLVEVNKQSGANTVAVVDALRERVAEIQAELPPSYRIEVVRDESEFIRNAVHAVQEHLVLGGILASIVVLLFLWNGRSTVIAALAIPSSIIATFALIAALGLTLNIITLLALTLSVGIVIDDAIVVLENIVRFIEEKGYSPKRAAVVATREIGLAVLATSLSLVAVFMPIAFMSGIIGRFMSSFGWTMSFAILISLFISFTLTPMLSSRWIKGAMKPGEKKDEEGGDRLSLEPSEADLTIADPPPGDRSEERAQYLAWARGERNLIGEHGTSKGLYAFIERSYLWLLAHAMRHRWVIAILLVAILGSLVPLVQAVPKGFLPDEDESRFEISIRAPEGTSLAQTELVAERLARAVRAVEGVHHTVATVGSPAGDRSGRGPNEASIYVGLVSPDDRDLSQAEVIERVRRDVLARFADQDLEPIVAPVNVFGGSGAQSAPIQYVLSGPDLALLEQYANHIVEGIEHFPGVADAGHTFVTGRPAYSVRIDRRRAADLGVSVSDIAQTLRVLVAGVDVGDFAEGGEQFDIYLQALPEERDSPDAIGRMTVPSSTPGRSVRLADVASIEPTTGPAVIQHLNRQRQVMIYCTVNPGASETAITAELDRLRDQLTMEPGYRASLTGRSRELGRALQSFLFAVFLSFTFMYLVLAAQFESWIHPITILSSLPLTLP